MSKKPNTITLPDSKKEFISLGNYMDNNDGIAAYYPNSDTFEEWKSFFLSESPIIQIFALQHFDEIELESISDYSEIMKGIFSKNKSLISGFISKNYDWPYDDERFEDSIWFHGSDEFEYECKNLINEGEDLSDQLFVIKEHHKIFIKELSLVLKVLFKKEV